MFEIQFKWPQQREDEWGKIYMTKELKSLTEAQQEVERRAKEMGNPVSYYRIRETNCTETIHPAEVKKTFRVVIIFEEGGNSPSGGYGLDRTFDSFADAAKAFEYAFVEKNGWNMVPERTKYSIQEQPSGTLHAIPEPKKQFTVQYGGSILTTDKFVNEPFDTLEEARAAWIQSRKHYYRSGAYLADSLTNSVYRILETPGDIVHACYVEPKKNFQIQLNRRDGWGPTTFESADHPTLEAAIAHWQHTWPSGVASNSYRILETPGDIIHEIPAPDVTVVVKVSVPAKQWETRNVHSSYCQQNGLYICMTGSCQTVKILSVTEEK